MCMCATISLEKYWCPDHTNLYIVHDVCIHLCLGSLIIIHLFMMLPCGTHFLTTSKQLPQCTLQKNTKEPIIISYTFLFPFKEQHSFFITRANMPSFNYFSLLNFSVILFHFCLSILWNSLPVSVTLFPVLAYFESSILCLL